GRLFLWDAKPVSFWRSKKKWVLKSFSFRSSKNLPPFLLTRQKKWGFESHPPQIPLRNLKTLFPKPRRGFETAPFGSSKNPNARKSQRFPDKKKEIQKKENRIEKEITYGKSAYHRLRRRCIRRHPQVLPEQQRF
ncbi:MAG: hypothetical protein PUA86_00375, partial [Clostridiaceae bacterium]|nr:hypothetical protein [Clostridiaceae bacterium]